MGKENRAVEGHYPYGAHESDFDTGLVGKPGWSACEELGKIADKGAAALRDDGAQQNE